MKAMIYALTLSIVLSLVHIGGQLSALLPGHSNDQPQAVSVSQCASKLQLSQSQSCHSSPIQYLNSNNEFNIIQLGKLLIGLCFLLLSFIPEVPISRLYRPPIALSVFK